MVSISAAKNTQYAKQDSTGASAYEMNQVGQVTVANGALVIEGLVTRANLSRKAGGTSVLDTNGTTAAKITLNGKVLSLSALNNLEIPGIAKIRTNVVTKSTNQIDVIGVQLQLLDGSNTYVNLSRATVGITPKS